MTQWTFVISAYGIVIAVTAAITVASFVSMRRAEAAADALRDRK